MAGVLIQPASYETVIKAAGRALINARSQHFL